MNLLITAARAAASSNNPVTDYAALCEGIRKDKGFRPRGCTAGAQSWAA
jgi:hypothetical protein